MTGFTWAAAAVPVMVCGFSWRSALCLPLLFVALIADMCIMERRKYVLLVLHSIELYHHMPGKHSWHSVHLHHHIGGVQCS